MRYRWSDQADGRLRSVELPKELVKRNQFSALVLLITLNYPAPGSKTLLLQIDQAVCEALGFSKNLWFRTPYYMLLVMLSTTVHCTVSV